MQSHIHFNQVGHHYSVKDQSSLEVLSALNFSVPKNQFVAAVGPSGCGKSTLLRLLSGLTSPSSGQVLKYGTPISGPQSDIGMVFQSPNLLPWKSVLDNIMFPAVYKRGRASQQDKAKAIELLTLVGLKDFSEHMPNQLSGGMQQRVGIARALFSEPELLVMDEPFSALDALSREKMGFELLDIWQQAPKTVLFITHSISEAVLLADRVLVLSPRPATIVDDITISLDRPRRLDSITDEQFSTLTKRIRQRLYQPNLYSETVS